MTVVQHSLLWIPPRLAHLPYALLVLFTININTRAHIIPEPTYVMFRNSRNTAISIKSKCSFFLQPRRAVHGGAHTPPLEHPYTPPPDTAMPLRIRPQPPSPLAQHLQNLRYPNGHYKQAAVFL